MRVSITIMDGDLVLPLPERAVDVLGLRPGVEVECTVVGAEIRVRRLHSRPSTGLADLLARADAIGWQNQPPIEDWSDVEAPWPEE